jgi:hypothetical protein
MPGVERERFERQVFEMGGVFIAGHDAAFPCRRW